MKILCRRNDEEFRPAPFDKRTVQDIADDVHDAVFTKYGKRFKKIDVEVSDILYDDNTVSFDVKVYNGDKLKMSGHFEFTPYSDYWDVSDYDQHRNTTVSRFVNGLVD